MSPKAEPVKMKHAYTQEDLPWRMDAPTHIRPVTVAGGQTYTWRLFQYLSSGGCAQCGRTVVQEVERRRQTRFFRLAAAIAAVWLLAIWL